MAPQAASSTASTMTTTTAPGNHPGEMLAFQTLNLPAVPNPAHTRLPAAHAQRIADSPLFALGTVDASGAVWATITGGARGVARREEGEEDDVLVIEGRFAGGRDDAVAGVLLRAHAEGRGRGWPVCGCSLDPATRDRVKLAGTLLSAEAMPSTGTSRARVRVRIKVDECLGNCPKYITMREIRPLRSGSPSRGSPPLRPRAGDDEDKGLPLGEAALEVIRGADMVFVASTFGDRMDLNHRGGKPGFLRVESNDADGVSLVWPEYSGNNLCQTLGNLLAAPSPPLALAVPSLAAPAILHLSGTASVLLPPDAQATLPRARLAVRLRVARARFLPAGLPFTEAAAAPVERSPYNPPVRLLAAEAHIPGAAAGGHDDTPATTAVLRRREVLTPSINRYTFTLASSSASPRGTPSWHAGQYATLDFDDLLGRGYRHMDDDDPQSLNEDLVRTFTVSSPPPREQDGRGREPVLEITAKRHGKATAFLAAAPVRPLGDGSGDGEAGKGEQDGQADKVEIPLLGFGGLPSFRMRAGDDNVFIAGGVGITPLLAQAPLLLDPSSSSSSGPAPLAVLWSLRREDVGLALDSFSRRAGLAPRTTIFLTGPGDGSDEAARLREAGAAVLERRLGEEDVRARRGQQGRRWFLCAGGGLLAAVQGWLEGESVVWEEFSY